MRIGTLAQQLSTTPEAIRFYERSGLFPAARRAENNYREYTETDREWLRVLIGLRQLDLPLAQAAELASLCLEGHCDRVSGELLSAITVKRADVARRIEELHFLDAHLGRLASQLSSGQPPRPLIAKKGGTP